jgi:hypothetical protein
MDKYGRNRVTISSLEELQGKVSDREESKKVLRTARNHRILHMANE